jgi:hypothetical protein
MVSKYRVATPPIRLALSLHVMSMFVGGIKYHIVQNPERQSSTFD